MPNEALIDKIQNFLGGVVAMGGASERTGIVTNLTVIDAAPAGLTGYVIVQDDRDGDYIPAKKVPGVLYANSDLVNVLFIKGTEPVAFQQASESGGSPIAVSKLVSPDLTIDPVFSADNSGHSTAVNDVSADTFAFIVENTSGGAATANDVGYIDEAGEYQTTATANDDKGAVIVIQGGANAADIYVTKRGRVTVAYAGAAPTAGDFLTFSTTAGSSQTSTVMRPEAFAVCLENGSGGTVVALLLATQRTLPRNSSFNLFNVDAASASDFVSVIAAAGVVGDKVYYGAISSGAVDAITPVATDHLFKIVLHNTTQTAEAFIIATGTDGTGDFIQVSAAGDISAWIATDAITTRSQTNTPAVVAGSYFFDLETANTDIPLLITTVHMQTLRLADTGAVNTRMFIHPFEANDFAKRQQFASSITALTTGRPAYLIPMPLIQRRFQICWLASGAGTMYITLRIREVIEAAP